MTLLFFILNIPNAIGKDEDYIGVVYWRGFDIESITGIPESQINNYGMKRCIGRNVFMGLLFHINDSYSREYDDRDVRGSITFNNDIYYVNRSGIVREGANKRGNSSRLTQSFHFFMFEPIFSPVNALNQPI